MTLEKADYFDAIQKSFQNAEELLEEARILKKHNKVARAYTLFQMCIEEIGKASMTFAFVLYKDIEDSATTNKFFKQFRDHKIKTSKALGIDLMFALNSENELSKEVLNNFLTKFDKTDISNDYKNYSLYTSLIENKFYLPSEMITKDLVDEIEYFADFRLRIAKPFIEGGIDNFEILYKTRENLDKSSTIEEAGEKIKYILGLK